MLLFLLACAGPPEAPVAPAAEKPTPVEVPSEGLDADLEHTLAFHATRPIYEQPHGVGLKVPEGLPNLSAETCGACHTEIYAEWSQSTHSKAWVDPQLQAEMAKSGNRWLCVHCHTPLLVQQQTWAIGLVEDDVEAPQLVTNASFDAELREEGITCAACHVRDGVIVGPGLTDSTAPHPVRAEERFTNEDLCLRCHQAVQTYPGKTFVCTFQTGEEWEAGPYPGEGKGCRDCHMPEVERPVAVGGPIRKVRRHGWRGAGIAKVEGIQPPISANPPGLDIEASWSGQELALTLTNARAGHKLPTGDPERWVQVDVHFEDAAGTTIGKPWSDRMGQEWEWWPTPKKLGDTRLAPKQSKVETLDIPKTAVRAVIEASSHRMSEETQSYHELETYPISVVTHRMTVSETGSEGGLLTD
ncbi:MAG: hypothetical protein KC912_13675 [Proteobacteria bacterium]|nr:hypothetical protein [Pseudomonadota bacterium]